MGRRQVAAHSEVGRGRRSSAVTDYQRANALLWLAQGNEEVVHSTDVQNVLRTIPPTHAVRVRQTSDGVPVYRVTPAGQKWALAQLASSPAHGGTAANYGPRRKPAAATAEPVIETRPGPRGTDWRVVDYVRHVRTPWLGSDVRTNIVERAAKLAVRNTDPNRLTQRHTRDDDWVIVHSL